MPDRLDRFQSKKENASLILNCLGILPFQLAIKKSLLIFCAIKQKIFLRDIIVYIYIYCVNCMKLCLQSRGSDFSTLLVRIIKLCHSQVCSLNTLNFEDQGRISTTERRNLDSFHGFFGQFGFLLLMSLDMFEKMVRPDESSTAG